MIFALTTNAITIFIMYFYMYLLKSLYLLEFIVVYIFLEVECIYSNCISTVFFEMYLFSFISGFYIFIYIYWIGSNFSFYSIHVL